MVTERPVSRQARQSLIQIPFINTFDTVLEYTESFLGGRMDFVSSIGIRCPVCGREQCYREITPYWRYAIDLFPGYSKERIPVARFLCRQSGKTFSLLPIQMIPYFQYTAHAVIRVLLLALTVRETGQRGFHGAATGVDPDSGMTPWLVTCWFMTIVRGFRRAHATLIQWYDLSGARSREKSKVCEEVSGYFSGLDWLRKVLKWDLMALAVTRYSRQTSFFLFGVPSQWRGREGPL